MSGRLIQGTAFMLDADTAFSYPRESAHRYDLLADNLPVGEWRVLLSFDDIHADEVRDAIYDITLTGGAWRMVAADRGFIVDGSK